MASDKARIAVVGTGWWSTYTHIPGLLNNPAAELVAVPSAELLRIYLPSSLTHADYPALVGEQQPMDTVAVGTVMAVYNWYLKRAARWLQ